MAAKHTPAPWKLGQIDDHLGYDCMSAGVRCGPAVLDASDYGQRRMSQLHPQIREQMMADAKLISAAPDLLAALTSIAETEDENDEWDGLDRFHTCREIARSALSKATS